MELSIDDRQDNPRDPSPAEAGFGMTVNSDGLLRPHVWGMDISGSMQANDKSGPLAGGGGGPDVSLASHADFSRFLRGGRLYWNGREC